MVQFSTLLIFIGDSGAPVFRPVSEGRYELAPLFPNYSHHYFDSHPLWEPTEKLFDANPFFDWRRKWSMGFGGLTHRDVIARLIQARIEDLKNPDFNPGLPPIESNETKKLAGQQARYSYSVRLKATPELIMQTILLCGMILVLLAGIFSKALPNNPRGRPQPPPPFTEYLPIS